ncbi:beta-class carbonic anhydrase [Nocardiopsis flavescens]|uniref:beta-class carbonic anhydrase n=1 Tax=Nocardiopsis flavescens TaxID=758803 RepID=UPI0036462418
MPSIDRLLDEAAAGAPNAAPVVADPRFDPALATAVVTCMDARIDVFALLGLRIGDAHVLRNAGGVITQDTLRGLVISQRLMGTRTIVVVHHTGCGMTNRTEDVFREEIRRDTGMRPQWAGEFMARDREVEELRQCFRRLRAEPLLPHGDDVRGYLYDMEACELVRVRPE